MFVFVCAGCGAGLTTPLSQVALPPHAHQRHGNATQLPALMERGTFAVDPDPWGPPWRRWEEIGPKEAAAHGVYAPVHSVSCGAPGTIVVAPADTRGTVLVPERSGNACCGLTGADGPNTACATCGLLVATRVDDCSYWQAVWLTPDAVHRHPVDDTDAVPLTWAELTAQEESTPPLQPIATWGGGRGLDHYWSWSPQWEAAAGQALAHLLAASEGHPTTVPDGLTAQLFRRALDTLLPPGPPPRHATLAGPAHPAPAPTADILLVPAHPHTGAPWTPTTPAPSTTHLVPLPFGIWRWLASPRPHLPTPASGVLPAEVRRDDPPPPHPGHLFRPDWEVFERTVTRLPAARSPWLRAALDNLTPDAHARLF